MKKFSHTPLIKFRYGYNKLSQPAQTQNSSQHNSSPSSSITESANPIIDNLRAVEASIRYRTQLSNEEIDIINNGGPIKVGNWQKIKLKK